MTSTTLLSLSAFLNSALFSDVVVALPPRGAVGVVIHRHGAQLGVVVAEVDDDLREPGLQPVHRVEVELLPLAPSARLVRDDHGVGEDVGLRDDSLRPADSARAMSARKGSLYDRATFTYVAISSGVLNSAPMWLSTCVGLMPIA